MKDTEIMIGDWIQCGGHYRRVQSIEYDNTEEKCWFWSDEDQALCLLSEHKPIPLTPEILKKNGFDLNGIPEDMQPVEERDWSDDTYVWSGQETPDECMQVSVYMDDPNNFFAEIICQYCHVDGVHIKYVHEFQHALRLCGIKKEIEL